MTLAPEPAKYLHGMKVNLSARPSRTCSGASKTKLVLFICILGLSGLSVLLLAKNQAQQGELQRLRPATEELATLRQQVAELDNLRAENQQLQKLRQDQQELIKLRGEVNSLRTLREAQQKLLGTNLQLQTTVQQLQATIQQLQKSTADTVTLRTQNEQLQGVLAQQQRAAQIAACSAHLRSIQAAKNAWAQDNQKAPIDIPSEADLFGPNRYIPQKPACPAGGAYTIGAVNQKATCNIEGHQF